MVGPRALVASLCFALAGAIVAVGCSGGGHGGSSGFVASSPSASPTPAGSIGAAGGTATGPSGSDVQVPPGALSSPQTITLTTGSASPPAGFVAAGPAIQLQPDGLTFQKPVTVHVPFTGSPQGIVQVYHLSSTGQSEMLPVLSSFNGVVTATLTHFSIVMAVVPAPTPSPSPASSPSSSPGPSGPPAGVWDQTNWDNSLWQ